MRKEKGEDKPNTDGKVVDGKELEKEEKRREKLVIIDIN
jgi:hypothetical protein